MGAWEENSDENFFPWWRPHLQLSQSTQDAEWKKEQRGIAIVSHFCVLASLCARTGQWHTGLTAARTTHTQAHAISKSRHGSGRSSWSPTPIGRSSWQLTAGGEGEAGFSSGIWALGGYPAPAAGPTSVHTQAAVKGLSGHWKQRTHQVWKETLWWAIEEENLGWNWSKHIMYMYKY